MIGIETGFAGRMPSTSCSPSRAAPAPARGGLRCAVRGAQLGGQGLLNSEDSAGLSSPRWPRWARGQGRDEKRPSPRAQRASVPGECRSSGVEHAERCGPEEQGVNLFTKGQGHAWMCSDLGAVCALPLFVCSRQEISNGVKGRKNSTVC